MARHFPCNSCRATPDRVLVSLVGGTCLPFTVSRIWMATRRPLCFSEFGERGFLVSRARTPTLGESISSSLKQAPSATIWSRHRGGAPRLSRIDRTNEETLGRSPSGSSLTRTAAPARFRKDTSPDRGSNPSMLQTRLETGSRLSSIRVGRQTALSARNASTLCQSSGRGAAAASKLPNLRRRLRACWHETQRRHEKGVVRC